MFPIKDVQDKVIAFGGRVLDDSKPKYINSPENIVYSKGRQLFGLNIAKNSVEIVNKGKISSSVISRTKLINDMEIEVLGEEKGVV